MLWLDTETRSALNVKTSGSFNYAQHSSTKILLFPWAFDDEEIQIWEPHLSPIPSRLEDGLKNPFETKVAWHCTFDKLIIESVLGIPIPDDEWIDPMIQARSMCMPGGLDDVSKILNLKFAKVKLALRSNKREVNLVDLFCEPAIEGGEVGLFGISEPRFHDHNTRPKQWQDFKTYAMQDVAAMREAHQKMEPFPLLAKEYRLWLLDQTINRRGMPVDIELVAGAQKIVETEQQILTRELKKLTRLENPNSNDQILRWAKSQGYPFDSVEKTFIERALDGEAPNLTDLGHRGLELRQKASKSSVSKLYALIDQVSSDNRLRGQFSFGGASRTMRWSGKGVQLQNLPRSAKEVDKVLPRAIDLLRRADHQTITKEFSSVLDVPLSCLRSMFKAPVGFKFVIADLSAIECRVLAWLSGCGPMLQVFAKNLDPYIDFASAMFKKPYDKVTKDERQKAKPPVLGAGFCLGGGEEKYDSDGILYRTGLLKYAYDMGVKLTPKECFDAVALFRKKFSEVVEFWYALDQGAINAVYTLTPQRVGHLIFDCHHNVMTMELPSGRKICYLRPQVHELNLTSKKGNPYTKQVVSFEGQDQKTKQWVRVQGSSSVWVENPTQAVARDILGYGMILAEKAGFEIVGHVHDELITLVPENSLLTVRDLEQCMSTSPDWALDLPLKAEGFETIHYRKN